VEAALDGGKPVGGLQSRWGQVGVVGGVGRMARPRGPRLPTMHSRTRRRHALQRCAQRLCRQLGNTWWRLNAAAGRRRPLHMTGCSSGRPGLRSAPPSTTPPPPPHLVSVIDGGHRVGRHAHADGVPPPQLPRLPPVEADHRAAARVVGDAQLQLGVVGQDDGAGRMGGTRGGHSSQGQGGVRSGVGGGGTMLGQGGVAAALYYPPLMQHTAARCCTHPFTRPLAARPLTGS
jgi:hypothetical protein